uniref:Uncharacterized protein n=1 Tax=Triticum urartu TaxID=4572 RepID=A0A8R7PH97_TRIUA
MICYIGEECCTAGLCNRKCFQKARELQHCTRLYLFDACPCPESSDIINPFALSFCFVMQ